MGGICEVLHCNGLRWHVMLPKIHKELFRHSHIDKGKQEYRQHGDLISLLYFSKIRKVGQK
jgi:hypothetical protein